MSELSDKLNASKKPEETKKPEVKQEEVKREPAYKNVFTSSAGFQIKGEIMRPDKLGFFHPKNEKEKAFCEKQVKEGKFTKV